MIRSMKDNLPTVRELVGRTVTAVDLDESVVGIGEGGYVLTLDDGRRMTFHGEYDENTVARFLDVAVAPVNSPDRRTVATWQAMYADTGPVAWFLRLISRRAAVRDLLAIIDRQQP